MITPSIFDLRVDCSREIDYDFFEDVPPSSSTNALWEGEVPSESHNEEEKFYDSKQSTTDSVSVLEEEENVISSSNCLEQQSAPQNDRESGCLFLERGEIQSLQNTWEDVVLPPELRLDPQKRQFSNSVPEKPELHVESVSEGSTITTVSQYNRERLSPKKDGPKTCTGNQGKPDSWDEGLHPRKSGHQNSKDQWLHEASACHIKNESPFGVTELVIVPKRSCESHKSTTSYISGISSGPSCSSEDSSVDDDEGVSVATITGALRCLTSPSSTLSYASSLSKPSGPNRINMSFSNDEARRIQRENEILLKRIVAQKARVPLVSTPTQRPTRSASCARLCSHAVNRARRSRDIQRDNEILLKKIQAVKRSSSQLSMVSRSSSVMSGRA